MLTLSGPDGKPVRDLKGNLVGPVKTDKNGHYLFSNLPPLPKGQHYTVSVDRDAASTKDVLKDFKPTKEGKDSWTWEATSGDLSKANAQDLTLDFGFVKKSDNGVGGEGDNKNGGDLPDTGNPVSTGWLMGGLGMVLAGAALVLFGRRRKVQN